MVFITWDQLSIRRLQAVSITYRDDAVGTVGAKEVYSNQRTAKPSTWNTFMVKELRDAGGKFLNGGNLERVVFNRMEFSQWNPSLHYYPSCGNETALYWKEAVLSAPQSLTENAYHVPESSRRVTVDDVDGMDFVETPMGSICGETPKRSRSEKDKLPINDSNEKSVTAADKLSS